MADPYAFQLLLDEEDRRILEDCAEADKLSKSDILRRALRSYAATLAEEHRRREELTTSLRTSTTE